MLEHGAANFATEMVERSNGRAKETQKDREDRGIPYFEFLLCQSNKVSVQRERDNMRSAKTGRKRVLERTEVGRENKKRKSEDMAERYRARQRRGDKEIIEIIEK